MKPNIIEVRLGEIVDGELPLEVWIGVSKSEDGSHSMQQALATKVPVEIPIARES